MRSGSAPFRQPRVSKGAGIVVSKLFETALDNVYQGSQELDLIVANGDEDMMKHIDMIEALHEKSGAYII